MTPGVVMVVVAFWICFAFAVWVSNERKKRRRVARRNLRKASQE